MTKETNKSIKDLHISFESMFTQVQTIIKNSTEMQDQLPLAARSIQYLDVGTAHTLETQLSAMVDAVVEHNQESKFNKHQTLVLKQYQEKTRWVQKRLLEN